MAIDNYTANKSFIFEHKEQKPRYVQILCIIFLLIAIPVMFLCFKRISEQNLTYAISTLLILVPFALLILAVDIHWRRFNFYYIVTVDEDSFTIGIPDSGYVQTKRFSRQIEYQFKEKSRLVYMRSELGHRYGFRYDEPFRKFLEEIQIK